MAACPWIGLEMRLCVAMTPAEIIADTCIPKTSIFVLGSYERRVTVYAQQVRALNLVDALLSENLVRPNGKVAIIGGGASGVTAAAAFARSLPGLDQLDLFEARPNVLELQRGSSRYLHPHFYDWPNPLAANVDAGLPIMNWQAGPAGDVAAALKVQFESFRQTSGLTPHLAHKVTKLDPSNLGQVRVVVPDSTSIRRIYDIVILAIGFGIERFLDKAETRSYWSPSDLAGPIHLNDPNPRVLVSGNGDGGLVDFMMAAFDGLSHQAICELLMDLDLGPAAQVLEAIEIEGWADGANLDFLAEYRNRIKHLIPPQTWAEITDRLRPGVRITLHTKETFLLRRTTALHNRLGVFLLLEADSTRNPAAITLLCGDDFAGAVPRNGPVTIGAAAAFEPQRRYLRLGADATSNFEPFKDLLATYPGAIGPRLSATQPASPILSVSAADRFTIAPAPVDVEPAAGHGDSAAPNLPANIISISLNPGENGEIVWAGDVGPGDAGDIWATGSAVHVFCAVAASAASPILTAIARLGCHAAGFKVSAVDEAGWRAGMSGLCVAGALPGPNIPIGCSVDAVAEMPSLVPRLTARAMDLAAVLQSGLDTKVLEILNASLFNVLGPAAEPMGWPIEATLRTRLWDRWQQWHVALAGDAAVNRRFLRLLASEKDVLGPSEIDLIRLGPKIIQPYLTEPAIFGLTFSVCSGHALAPANAHPGNIAVNALTGHSCGVAWIDSRVIRRSSLSKQAWTTGVVLLSQLREAFQMREGELRMDRDFADRARVGLIAPSEEPLVIGAEEGFTDALEVGEAEVQSFFESIFAWRAKAADDAFERTKND